MVNRQIADMFARAMLWLRGDRRDFDTWKVPGWSADELWPSFNRAESTEDGLGVTRLTGRHPWSPAFVEAALDTGYGSAPAVCVGSG